MNKIRKIYKRTKKIIVRINLNKTTLKETLIEKQETVKKPKVQGLEYEGERERERREKVKKTKMEVILRGRDFCCSFPPGKTTDGQMEAE